MTRRVRQEVRRHAATLALAVVVLACSLAASLADPGGEHVRALLGAAPDTPGVLHAWPLTLALVAHGPAPLAAALIGIVVIVGLAEGLMGWWRTLVAYLVPPVAGALLGFCVSAVTGAWGRAWPEPGPGVVDPLLGVVGVAFAASGFAHHLWRRRIRTLGFTVLVLMVLYSGAAVDVYRLGAAVVGLAIGIAFVPHGRAWLRIARSSHHEARTLFASIIALVAVGPFVTLATATPQGPLHTFGALLASASERSAGACDDLVATAQCLHALAVDRAVGAGPLLLSVLPLAVLLMCAYGLQRGRRAAVWIASAVLGLLSALAALYYGLLPLAPDPAQLRVPAGESGFAIGAVLSVVVPLVLALALPLNLRHFPVRPSARGARVFWIVTSSALAVTGAAYVGVGIAVASQFTPPVSVLSLLIDLPERYVPVGFLHLRTLEFVPTGPVAAVVYTAVGPLFWGAALVAAVVVLTSAADRAGASDIERVRSLLRAGSSGSLGHLATWQGNSYWFTPEGGAAVAYRVVSGVALTTGGPIGPVEEHPAAVRGFAAHCDERGIIPAFYSVDEALLPVLTEAGWHVAEVGDDTIIDPATFTLAGGRWKDIRTSINRAARTGVSAQWTTWAELPLTLRTQIEAISEEWIAGRGLPELGFTLGGIDELADADVRLMLAVTESGSVLAATSWLPTYRDGVLIGRTLEFMRRRPDAMNGVMEFLIAETISRASRDGLEFVSLSAAPLSRVADPEGDQGVATQVLGWVGRRLEGLYGFRSLLAYKMKFAPRFRPLHLAYRDSLALPAIGVALARAYLPAMTVPQAVSIMRSMLRSSDTGRERERVRVESTTGS